MANSGRSTSRSSTWKGLRRLLDNPPSHEIIRSEVQLAVDNGNTQAIRGLEAGDQAKFLELVDQAAPKILAKDTKFVTTLGDISSDILRLPSSVGSLQGLKKRGEIAVASGGTTDIWRGTWNSQQVAFKAFRIYPPQDLQEAKKILWKVVPTWKRLVHENVLPFHGVDTSTPQLALVHDWAQNGDITQYLKSNPGASRYELVKVHLWSVHDAFSDRFRKLLQVARGLQHLHSLEIIHGNLKGANVLISKTGTAQVCDYGLSPIISNPAFVTMIGSSRWLAPEIIDPSSSNPLTASKSADIFAFAMLAVEVFTGDVPFGSMTEGSVAVQITNGKRPTKPQVSEWLGLTAEMWKFIEKCWAANPSKRPTIDEVVTTWEGLVNRVPGRQSQFAEPSTVSAEKPATTPPRKRRFCGLF